MAPAKQPAVKMWWVRDCRCGGDVCSVGSIVLVFEWPKNLNAVP